ncbi:MAG TPA: YidC/Oxa1 family insertase periplasmic-domain containing protein, partial [Verrucomicrobiota bacterium]|nr:YidC/Oxa1 family insertase periplasmic-domain containing protein [Verrucomicrobiota bacterium]
EFRLGTNYLVSTKVTLENTTRGALTLPAQEWVIGTATPMSADDDGMAVGLMWYDGKKEKDITQGWFENKTLGCFPGVPRSVYREGLSNVVWASVHNQYFTMVTMPKVPAEQIVSRPVELPADLKHNPQQKGFQTALLVPAMTLAANQSVVNEFEVFAGPKEYRTLARIAARFQNNVDLIMGFGGFFGFFSKGLLLGMNWLHSVFHLSYAWSIIAITVIIKILFWPLTAASTRSMKRMAALQPQMKALQEKYKEDPAKLNKKMMEMWKEHKVSPIGGCLPIIIQMPVFIGFFYMIRSAIELRGASWFWVADLSRPDTLFYIPGFDFPFNLLPLIMGATMLWQSHLTPPSPGMDPVQQKMMRYMPLIFLVFLYNFSSGLALYWTVNNLLTILQTKLTKTKDPIIAAPAAASPLTH